MQISKARKPARKGSGRGFTLIEVSIVVAIFLLVASIAVPNISGMLATLRLRGAAQELAQEYQEARMRAVQDNTYYEVLPTSNFPGAFIDVGGAGIANGSPTVQLPIALTLSNANVPAGLDQKKLGFIPILTETSTMFDQDGTNRPGMAWNARGLPCQRASATSICQAGIGWLQYLQYPAGAQTGYAAVSVTPAGKVKVWMYKGGVWR